MPERRPSIAVLLHLAYPALWDELRTALGTLPYPFRLIVNLVAGLHDEDELARQRELLLRFDPDATVMVSPNRGLDVGGMLRMFDAVARLERDRPDACLYLHTKSDPGWRRRMIAPLVGHASTIARRLTRAAVASGRRPGMIGAGLYPFDYYNLTPALALLDRLGVAVETDWARYHAAYPESAAMSLDELLVDARARGAQALRPEIDVRYYVERIGPVGGESQLIDRAALSRMIDDGVLGPLPYFPGNIFWIGRGVIDELSAAVDLIEEADRLPDDIRDDVRVQSAAHAWERVLPIFALKRGWALVAVG